MAGFIHVAVLELEGHSPSHAYVINPTNHPRRGSLSMRGSHSPAGRGARRAQPADNASTASFATSSIKPHQRSHRMSETLDLDPCLARYTITLDLFSSDCFHPEHAASKTASFVALHFTLTCVTSFQVTLPSSPTQLGPTRSRAPRFPIIRF